ncbi:MAG: ankyrin repeat domain-containing protein [Sedimentisphaerales bacterium]|nr:ankyrin repeat domain-containing protein [Sedimentisphaerales bacterium]
MKRFFISMLVLVLLTSVTSISKGESEESDKTIHDAVVTGDIDQVKSLLAKGTDINLKNRMSWTPLHAAVQSRQKEIIELLVSKGADLNAINNRQQTPLHVAVNTRQKEIVELLISKGADINIQAGGDNALTFARRIRDTEIEEFLTKNGAKEPDPVDIMGDRYYPEGASQQQASAPARSTRGSSRYTRSSRAAVQPVQVDLLADPNEIKARIKTFAGLQKALDDVAAKSNNETRQWEQTRYDNRTMLVRNVQTQFEEEMKFLNKVSVSEKATKTTQAIADVVKLREERFKATSKELMVLKREEMQTQRTSTRTRGRVRTSTRGSTRGGYGAQSEQYDSSGGYGRGSSDPYGGRGGTSTRTGRQPATRPPSQQEAQPVDMEAENETRQWLQASFDDKSDLAGAVNDQIQSEFASIRNVAVEEKAKKTTAAIDGLLLARKIRLDAFLLKMEDIKLREQAQESRARGGYQQDSRYNMGGATRGGMRGSTRGGTTGTQQNTRRRR